MAIITINTTPISEFIIKFTNAVGETGWAIIIICIFLYLMCRLIEITREGEYIKRNKRKIDYDSKRVDFYHKKFDEAKTKEDFKKLEKWREKNEDAFFY